MREFLIEQGVIDAKPKPLVQVPKLRTDVGKLKVENVAKLAGDAE